MRLLLLLTPVGSLFQVIAYSIACSAPPFPVFVFAFFINGIGMAVQVRSFAQKWILLFDFYEWVLECPICCICSILQEECGNKNGCPHGWQVKLHIVILCAEHLPSYSAYGAFLVADSVQAANRYQVVGLSPLHS